MTPPLTSELSPPGDDAAGGLRAPGEQRITVLKFQQAVEKFTRRRHEFEAVAQRKIGPVLRKGGVSADDILQEAFRRLLVTLSNPKNEPDLESDGSVFGYFNTIISRCVIDMARRLQRCPQTNREDLSNMAYIPDHQIIEAMVSEYEERHRSLVVAEIQKERQLVQLVFAEMESNGTERSPEEINQRLDRKNTAENVRAVRRAVRRIHSIRRTAAERLAAAERLGGCQ